ncbi:flavin-containing monooxygenase 5-like [Lytechinus variegatus]|uniref:flavin-containing monooxygenase 5-like n=1 Tax=Lytechinus variegatus TaxID=7654 RepID=UPI001BB266AA|nr:flavin-containing monooxygenase 5-like [Lytechinus variegatus]
MAYRVAVIGAGASGLASIKTCLDENLEPVCYERSSHLGGLWYYSDDEPRSDPHGASAIYHGLHTNVSKEMMAFSDFPLAKSLPPFPKGSDIQEYYERYAEHFGLLKHINFNVEVVSIDQDADYEGTGRWKVTVRPMSGEIRSEVFDAVMVCTGLYPSGHLPDYPGLDSFKGQIMHSCQFKRGAYFTDKRVLVVGSGTSGGDISNIISHHASQVYLSLRHGAWCVPRFFYNKQTLQDFFNQRWKTWIPSRLLNKWLINKMNYHMDGKILGLQHSKLPFNVHCMVDEDLPASIMEGRVRIRSGIDRFEGSNVHFVDGSVIEDIDNVIFATGYDLKLPFLKNEIVPDGYDKIELYQYMIPIRLRHPTLSFVGLCLPYTMGHNALCEMQTRYITKVLKGEVKLPSFEEMQQEVISRKDLNYKLFENHQPFITDPTAYRDQLAKAIGALPNLTKLIFTDPVLAYHFYFGVAYPPCHRLVGPGATPGARQALIDCKENQVHGITLTTVRRDAKDCLQAYEDGQKSSLTVYIMIVGAILSVLVLMAIF